MKYRAVIEDNKDPLELSRVRVRIFGIHTQNNENGTEKFNFINSSELPWAEVIGGTDFGLVSGIGISSVLQQGTWVWVELDHDDPNKPIVIGTIKGVPKTRPLYSEGEGFNDKDDVFPVTARIDESDLNRLSRNKKLLDPVHDVTKGIYNSKDTAHKQINDNLDVQTGVTDAVSGADVSQTEPSSLNDSSVYPNASVIETPSGHTIEIDDTPSNERIRLRHASGSYMEMRPDGSIVQKSVGNTTANHYIHMSDVEEHVAKGVKKYIENNLEEIINQSVKRNIKANLSEHIGGNLTLNVDGNLNWNVGGTVTITSGGNYGVTAPRIDLN